MKAYTDYPFEILGDKPYCMAPIREVTMLSYDGNKYVEISVDERTVDQDGYPLTVKSGYLFSDSKMRTPVTPEELSKLRR